MADGHRVLAEFEDPSALVDAVERARSSKYPVRDAFVPHPVEGLDEALGLRRTRIRWLVLAVALLAGGTAYLVQWWVSVVAYPLNVGGRPLHSGPAFLLITFEMAILFGSVAGFLAFLFRGGMPRLWHPHFEVEGFETATLDGYWLDVVDLETRAPGEGATALERLLDERGAVRILRLENGEEVS